MKTKTLAILFIILGVLLVAGALINRVKAPGRSKGGLGAHLLEQLPANEITSIAITGPEKEVTLAKKRDQWVVENRFDFPADFSKIVHLVKGLKEAKVGRKFESSEDSVKRLSLKTPEDPDAAENEKGIRIQLKGKKGTTFATILLGKTRKIEDDRSPPDGRYVMLDKGSKIYLIDKHFSVLGEDPPDWLKKDLVQVKASEIKKIACIPADKRKVRFIFERSEKGKDLQPVIFPPEASVKKSALNRLAGALSSLRMQDVVKPSPSLNTTGMAFPTLIEYSLFNGMIYRVYPGKECSDTVPCYLKIEVDYKVPPTEEKGGSKGAHPEKEKTRSARGPSEYSLEAKRLNDRLSPWVYVVPKWQSDDFIREPGKLIEKIEHGERGKGGSEQEGRIRPERSGH